MIPERIVHADWGTAPEKRWEAEATWRAGAYRVGAPRLAGNPLHEAVPRDEQTLLGFDFPIGIPQPYAELVGVSSFPALLPLLGRGQWHEFFEVATSPEEISLRRPFYPRRPGGTSQLQLLVGLGIGSIDQLRRRCERAHATRRAAQVLFWTLGPNQVGRAAIAGWRDMLIPSAGSFSMWPFEGSLHALLETARVVVCETYPGEFYGHLMLPADKTAAVRASAAPAIRAAVRRLGVEIATDLEVEIERGFAHDDAYDAFVGLLGMINVVTGGRAAAPELGDAEQSVEGWILGQASAATTPQGG